MRNFRQCVIKRQIRERILILCEGSKTEPNYFKSIKLDKSLGNSLSAVVIHDTKINTAKELVEVAFALKKQAKKEYNPYQDIWVVVDKDGYTRHGDAFDKARTTGINIAFSSPCFEFWYLLHFIYTTASFNDGNAMCRKICEHIPDYKKGENYYELLSENTNTAIEHCKRLINHWETAPAGNIWELNPYCDVHKLIEKLMSLT